MYSSISISNSLLRISSVIISTTALSSDIFSSFRFSPISSYSCTLLSSIVKESFIKSSYSNSKLKSSLLITCPFLYSAVACTLFVAIFDKNIKLSIKIEILLRFFTISLLSSNISLRF